MTGGYCRVVHATDPAGQAPPARPAVPCRGSAIGMGCCRRPSKELVRHWSWHCRGELPEKQKCHVVHAPHLPAEAAASMPHLPLAPGRGSAAMLRLPRETVVPG